MESSSASSSLNMTNTWTPSSAFVISKFSGKCSFVGGQFTFGQFTLYFVLSSIVKFCEMSEYYHKRRFGQNQNNFLLNVWSDCVADSPET